MPALNAYGELVDPDDEQPMADTPWNDIGWARDKGLTEEDFSERSEKYRDIQAVIQQRQFTVTALTKLDRDELVYIAGHRDGISEVLYRDAPEATKAERYAKVKANAIRAQHVLNEKFLERQAAGNRWWAVAATLLGAAIGAGVARFAS